MPRIPHREGSVYLPRETFSSASPFAAQLKVSRCNYLVVSEWTRMTQRSRDIEVQGLPNFEHEATTKVKRCEVEFEHLSS
jgi:hypothetical protein